MGTTPQLLGGDARDYHRLAENLVRHGAYSLQDHPPYGPSAYRTPGYPLFLAAIYATLGPAPWLIRAVQLLLHGFTAWYLFLFGSRFIGRRAALLGSLQLLVYLPFVFATANHLTENLSIFLTVLLFYLAIRLHESRHPGPALALLTGVTAAVLTLTRAALAPFLLVPLAGLLLSRERKSRLARARSAALVLLGCAVTLGPWFAYTARVVGKPVVSLSGTSNLWTAALQYSGRFSFACLPADWEVFRQGVVEMTSRAEQQVDPSSPIAPTIQVELSVQDQHQKEAARLLRGVGPVRLLRQLPTATFWLWSTAGGSSQPLLRRGAQLQWLIWVLLTVYGAWKARGHRTLCWMLGSSVAYIILIHLIFHVEPRYSFPVRALLFVPAGLGLSECYTRFRYGRRATSVNEPDPNAPPV